MDNGQEPATRQDLANVRREIGDVRQELRQDIAILRSEMNHQYDDLKETMRDIQTEMMKAFYSFAELNQNHSSQ